MNIYLTFCKQSGLSEKITDKHFIHSFIHNFVFFIISFSFNINKINKVRWLLTGGGKMTCLYINGFFIRYIRNSLKGNLKIYI